MRHSMQSVLAGYRRMPHNLDLALVLRACRQSCSYTTAAVLKGGIHPLAILPNGPLRANL